MKRKDFLNRTLLAALAAPLMTASQGKAAPIRRVPALQLSLSQWALHRATFGQSKENYETWQRLLHSDPDRLWQGPLHPLDFPAKARELGFEAVEYVNSLFYGHAQDQQFLQELKHRTEAEGVANILLMVDEEGFLGHPDAGERTRAIDNHVKWLEAAAFLGCRSMRVNAHSIGSAEEQKQLAADGLHRLAEKAQAFNLNLLIENHGGMSSHADWLVETITLADHPALGTVVDFDNFTFSPDFIWGDGDIYNRYIGVEKLMPLAKSISAKTHRFDIQGFETSIDYPRMMRIIKAAGFDQHICVEYEGEKLSEEEGLLATRALIEKAYALD